MYENQTTKHKFEIKIQNEINSFSKKYKKKEIFIEPPKICPICGSSEISNDRYLFNKSKFNLSAKRINVLVCNKHIHDGSYQSFWEYFIVFLILLSMFLAIIFRVIIVFMILIGLLFIYSWSRFGAKSKKVIFIKDYLIFNYFPEYSILTIKREDWAEEFRKLNQKRITT